MQYLFPRVVAILSRGCGHLDKNDSQQDQGDSNVSLAHFCPWMDKTSRDMCTTHAVKVRFTYSKETHIYSESKGWMEFNLETNSRR